MTSSSDHEVQLYEETSSSSQDQKSTPQKIKEVLISDRDMEKSKKLRKHLQM